MSLQPLSSTVDSLKHSETEGPSRIELVLLWLIAAICFLIVLIHFQSYLQKVADFGDNGEYVSAAHAIQHWDLRSTHAKQGWGLSN